MKVRITATRHDSIEVEVEVADGTSLDNLADDRWQRALYEAREADVIERHFTVVDVERR